jgi:hypothetical protein
MSAGAGAQTFWLGRAVEAQQDAQAGAPAIPAPRHSVRRALHLQALINHGLSYSSPWHVRDLSLTGAFVEMVSSPLPVGSYVEMVLRYALHGATFEHRLPATVTRLEGAGMALTFGAYDDDTYTALANLLYAQ